MSFGDSPLPARKLRRNTTRGLPSAPASGVGCIGTAASLRLVESGHVRNPPEDDASAPIATGRFANTLRCRLCPRAPDARGLGRARRRITGRSSPYSKRFDDAEDSRPRARFTRSGHRPTAVFREIHLARLARATRRGDPVADSPVDVSSGDHRRVTTTSRYSASTTIVLSFARLKRATSSSSSPVSRHCFSPSSFANVVSTGT